MEKFAITTLKNRCLDVLAKNVDTLIEYLDDESKGELRKLVKRIWSNDLIQRVEEPLQKRHASFFINGYLEKLNLRQFCRREIEAVIDVLKVQGEGILHLSLEELLPQRYSEATVLHLAESLPSTLTHLRFQGLECSDTTLAIVAKNCPNLQQLHLCMCKNVTDNGMAALFAKPDESPNTEMQFLNLRGTSVSERGILTVLECCPNLTDLCHPRLNSAIVSAYHGHLQQMLMSFKTYKLKKLLIDSQSRASLSVLIPWQVMCPGVENLTVECIETQDELDICSNFKCLKHVSFGSLKPVLITYFLETRGPDLESLTVFGNNITLSIASIVKFCPNITCLTLFQPRFVTPIAADTSGYSMLNLRALEIMHTDVGIAKREMTALFLSSPNIEKIRFWEVSGFTNEFASLITMQKVVKLRSLQVMCCDIHPSTLENIIMASPCLTSVWIYKCKYISPEQGKDLGRSRDGFNSVRPKWIPMGSAQFFKAISEI